MSALRHRSFAIFWCGALLSNIGVWLSNLALPFLVFQMTGSIVLVGAFSVAQYLPMVVTSPIGGGLADRLSRRRILIWTQTLMAATATVTWLAWVAGVATPALLLASATVSGLLNGLNVPAWQSLVNDLVPREDLMSAVTLNSVQFNVSRTLGPALAGVMLATLGPGWTLGVNALSFAFVIAALVAIRGVRQTTSPPDGRGFLPYVAVGARYLTRQPGIVMSMLMSVLLGLLINPVFAFTVVFADVEYQVGAAELGLLNVALGIGSIALAVQLSRRGMALRLSVTARAGLVGLGLCAVVFGVSPSYLVGLVALVGVGAGFLTCVATAQTATQTIVADSMRGRVMAFRLMFVTLSFAVGGLAQGAIAEVIGARRTVVASGVTLLVATVLASTASRTIRLARLDDPHDDGR